MALRGRSLRLAWSGESGRSKLIRFNYVLAWSELLGMWHLSTSTYVGGSWKPSALTSSSHVSLPDALAHLSLIFGSLALLPDDV